MFFWFGTENCVLCTSTITNKSPGVKCEGKGLKYFVGKYVGLINKLFLILKPFKQYMILPKLQNR